MFYIDKHDEFLCHRRDLYLCEWNDELQANNQELIASGYGITAKQADIWVKTQLIRYLTDHEFLVYS